MTRAARVAVCVFAKPPREGQVKTRLAAAVGDAASVALAWAFLRDTWAMVNALPWAQPVLAPTECTPELVAMAGAHPLWVQGPGDLGAKLESVARQAFAAGLDAVIEIGSDSPGLPPAFLHRGASLLQSHDAVMGLTDDGGFYALGLSRCVPDLLSHLPWSQPTTAARTQAQLQSLGFHVGFTPPWFDVDELADLRRLQTLLESGRIAAPHTTSALAKLNLGNTS